MPLHTIEALTEYYNKVKDKNDFFDISRFQVCHELMTKYAEKKDIPAADIFFNLAGYELLKISYSLLKEQEFDKVIKLLMTLRGELQYSADEFGFDYTKYWFKVLNRESALSELEIKLDKFA